MRRNGRWICAVVAFIVFAAAGAARADFFVVWNGTPTVNCTTGSIDSFGMQASHLVVEASMTPCSTVPAGAKFGFLVFSSPVANGWPIQPYSAGSGTTVMSLDLTVSTWLGITAFCVTNTQYRRTACLGNEASEGETPSWVPIPGTDPRLQVPYGQQPAGHIDPNCATCLG